jgi:diguanylate cyclase (GGDEF)-like protein/PAS domain S-box-containing protein
MASPAWRPHRFRCIGRKNAEMTIVPQHGRAHFLFASGRALLARDGTKIGAVIALKDVTDLKESERRLEASERLLRTIADNLPVLIAYIDRDERYQFANATYEAWFGAAGAGMVGKTVKDVLGHALYEQGRAKLQANLAGEPVRFESEAAGPDGVRHIEVVGIPDTRDGVTRGAYVLTTDITAARRHQLELGRLARTDALTGLPNRRSHEERLGEALQRAARSGRGLALLFLDIDHFKQINDTLGHAGGDAVLQEFGRRLKASVRTTDIVSRLAGDEFTVVLEGLNDAQEAAFVARKIVDAFREPVRLEGASRQVSTSIGVAFVKARQIDMATLCHQADTALYRAKADGRNGYALF